MCVVCERELQILDALNKSEIPQDQITLVALVTLGKRTARHIENIIQKLADKLIHEEIENN